MAEREELILAALVAAQNAERQIPGAVSAWLEENVDPETGYVLDSSLTVAGAAADAKAAGDAVGELKSAINNCTTNLAQNATTLNGYYISGTGDISPLASGRNDSTIYVEAKPNKRYLIKKTNNTLLRVGLGNSSGLTSGRLSQFSQIDAGSTDTLYVTTSDTLKYIYVMLFGASTTETIVHNIVTLAIVEDVSYELEDNVNKLNTEIVAVDSKVDTLRNDVFFDPNIISVSASNISHVAGDATITFPTSDAFSYVRNTAENNQFGFTFDAQVQTEYTLKFSLKGISGGYVNVYVCPTAVYNSGAALASDTNITTDKEITLTFTATTAQPSLWFIVRYNVPQVNMTNLFCSDGVLNFKYNMMEYTGRDVSVFNKILCIGDSITEGTFNYTADGSSENFINIPKYSYPTQLKKITGVDTVNMGHGGYTAVEWYAAHSADDLSGYDCAVIGFGINDSLENVSLTDFTAAYHNIIDKLVTANKGIKVFLLTITPAYTDYNRRYDDYNEEIRRIADEDYANAYLVDLTQYSICKYGTAYAQGHLTAIGYMQMAQEISTIISYTIHTNPTEFRNVQFIGTDYTYNP